MEKIYAVPLYLSTPSTGGALFDAVQGDTCRKLQASIYNDDGTAFVPGSGIEAEYWSSKLDGNGTQHSATLSGNVVSVEFTTQDLACPGKVYATIILKETGGGILAAMPFHFMVHEVPMGNDIESTSDYQEMQEATDAANTAANKANAAAEHGPYIDENTLYWYVWDEEDQQYVNTYVVASGAAEGAVLYAQQTLTTAQQTQARRNIGADQREKLLCDEVPDTTQYYTFTGGDLTKIEHKSGTTAIRTDTFAHTSTTITEVRTLNTGESLTIVTNMETLQTTVTYID